MDIKTALSKLDPKNNDHWTSDGLPLVTAVEALTATQLSRAEITNAQPGFSRALALKALANVVTTSTAETEQAVQAVQNTQPQAGVHAPTEAPKPQLQVQQAEQPEVEDVGSNEDVDISTSEALQEAKARLEAKRKTKTEADAEYEKAQQAYDVALLAHEEATLANPNQGDVIQQYLRSQVQANQERAERINIIAESGIDLKGIQQSLGASALDQALASKR